MDLNQVLIAALLGGVFAGIGGAIGAFSARFFPEKFKTALIAGFAAIGIVASQTVHDEIKATSVKAEYQEELEKNAIFATLKRVFPDDYSRFLDEFSRVKTPAVGFDLGQKFTGELRKKNAIHARSASHSRLLTHIELELSLLESIRSQDGELACSAFLREGVPGLPGGYERYQSEISDSVEALFLALADGRDVGKSRSSPTSTDWEAFLEFWRTNGATDEQVALVLSPEPENASYCASHMSFLSGVIAYDGPTADSIRAELLFQKAIAE